MEDCVPPQIFEARGRAQRAIEPKIRSRTRMRMRRLADSPLPEERAEEARSANVRMFTMHARGIPDLYSSESEAATARNRFLTWQCKLRQRAMRYEAGRPSAGMRPALDDPMRQTTRLRITVLIVPREPAAAAAQFQYIVRMTNDPAERLAKGLQILSGDYFQHASQFSDEMTALFGGGSSIVEHLSGHGRCVLDFREGGVEFHVPCQVANLDSGHPGLLHTYWHNRIFGPDFPGEIRGLSFTPNWGQTEHDTST